MSDPLTDLRDQEVKIGDPVYLLHYGGHWSVFGRVRKIKHLGKDRHYLAIDSVWGIQTYNIHVNYIWGYISSRIIKLNKLTDLEQEEWDKILKCKNLEKHERSY